MEMQPVTNKPTFVNKSLQKATNLINAMGDQIRSKQFDIAAILADVENKGYYKDDGFRNAAEYAMETFGMQKTLAYNLIAIGTEYTRPVMGKRGDKTVVVGHASNLVPASDIDAQDAPVTDFTPAQIGRMLPLGRDKVVELIAEGRINPRTTFKEIETIVKELKPRKVKALPEPVEADTDNAEPVEAESAEQVTVDNVEQSPTYIDTVRGDGFDQLSTDILIAELRLRGFKVYKDGREYMIDWKGGENDAENRITD